ncbi:MAG: PIN domain-containing protein [Candidatus Diapherotrites archaeon]|nr:PIN domain-containing protein [Candidatus Diapherotrites archaeon]
MKFYLDTCIWMDYLESRTDGLRPLGEFAFAFLKACKTKKHSILFSELVSFELRQYHSEERIRQMFADHQTTLNEVSISNSQQLEAKMLELKLNEVHKSDILHAILARDNGAILITRDNHFNELSSLVKISKPEEVYF